MSCPCGRTRGEYGGCTKADCGGPVTPPVDYRTLLKRYMDHVGKIEGITFWPDEADGFSQAEVAELNRIDEEIGEDGNTR